MASVYEQVVNVISKHSSKRSDVEVQRLLPWFKKKSELFSSIQQDVVVDIIKNCEFSVRPRDNIVIKQGERGDCFFIMIKGVVSVYINNSLAEEEDETALAEQSSYDHLFNDKGVLDRSKFGTFIATLGAGKSFGELALINKNCIRNASILADETTDLIVINREVYNRCLHAAHAAEMEEKNRFVRECPLFVNWQQKYKKQMTFSLRKNKVPFNEFVVKQGESVDGLIFLLSGQAKVVIDPSQHTSQYPQFYPLEDPDLLTNRDEVDEPISSSSRPSKDQASIDKQNVTPSAHRRRERLKKRVELSIVTGREILGDTELGLSLKTYAESVISTQETEVFFINQRNFERLVSRKNQRTMDILRENAITKWQIRLDRLHHDEVPLLKTLIHKMYSANHPSSAKRRKDQRTSGSYLSSSASNALDFLPPRGPLIDHYGPGTVFYRNKLREQAKEKQKSKMGFRGFQTASKQPDSHDPLPQESAPPLPMKPMCETNIDDLSLYAGGIYDHRKELEHHMESYCGSDGDEDKADILGGIPLHPESTFVDYHSSDQAMSVLEEKIKNWHRNMSEASEQRTRIKNGTNGAVPLKRVDLDKEKLPVPGSKVLIKKKKPPFHLPQQMSSMEPTRNEVPDANSKPSHLQTMTPLQPNFNGEHSTKQMPRAYPNSKLLGSSKFNFRLEKKPTGRSYTPKEYEELKRLMQQQQRALTRIVRS